MVRRSGRKKVSGGFLIVLLVALLVSASVLILGASGYLPFSVFERKVLGVKFRVSVTPDVPVKVDVDDYGKTFKFKVDVKVEAPKGGPSPASVINVETPYRYVATNPLPVPADIKIPGERGFPRKSSYPFATTYLDNQGLDASIRPIYEPVRPKHTARFEIAIVGGNPPYKITVNWGDGRSPFKTTIHGKTYQVSHIYGKEGIYTVTLKVRDYGGREVIRTAKVTVSGGGNTVRATDKTPEELVAEYCKGEIVKDAYGYVCKTEEDKVVRLWKQGGGAFLPTTDIKEEIYPRYLVTIHIVGVAGRGNADEKYYHLNVLPGESESVSKTLSLKLTSESLETNMIRVELAVAYLTAPAQRNPPKGSAKVEVKAFEKVPLSKGFHIEGVATDAETGEVSFYLVNDWITPLRVKVGIIDPSDSTIMSVGNVPAKTVTIPSKGKTKVTFVLDSVRTYFANWRTGDSATYTKKISACIIPTGAAQESFKTAKWWPVCTSALAVWRKEAPKVKIVLHVSGQGSVTLTADGREISSGAEVETGTRIKVEASAGEGYTVGMMKVKNENGKTIYVENIPLMPESEWKKVMKHRSWSFIAAREKGREHHVYVSFTVPKSTRVYTTTTEITHGTLTTRSTITKVVGPEGEFRVDPNTLAAAKTYVSYRFRYHGYAEKVGLKDFPDPKNEFGKYVYRAHGTLTVILNVENTADRPIMFKDTIKLGGKQREPVDKTVVIPPFEVPPKSGVKKEFHVSLEGVWLTKPKGGDPYLPIEYYPMVKWADSPYANWVAAFSQMKVPILSFKTSEMTWGGETGGEYAPEHAAPKATEYGVGFPDVVVFKSENSLTPTASRTETEVWESYQPVDVELQRIPGGQKVKTVGVVEPPIAAQHETDPGVVSLVPEPPAREWSGFKIFDWLWDLLHGFWEWFLSILGAR